jgi:TetR/AcrR family transcriptional regulator, transcriptional repressor for nem operon
MRASREQFAENRQRILEVAGRLFRQKGFDAIGVDGIMEAAGLTHGGFYGHFDSKAHLAEQACSAGLEQTKRRWETLARDSPEAALAEIARYYLTKRHRDDPANGCVFAALGGDVARSSDAVRSTVTKGLRAQLGILERAAKGRSKAARRKQAITALSCMVGGMVVARLVNDSALSNEILTVAASAFGGNKNDNQKRTAV